MDKRIHGTVNSGLGEGIGVGKQNYDQQKANVVNGEIKKASGKASKDYNMPDRHPPFCS